MVDQVLTQDAAEVQAVFDEKELSNVGETTLADAADLDSASALNGMVAYGAGTANRPTAGTGIVITTQRITSSADAQEGQFAFDVDGFVYHRVLNSTVWGGWIQLSGLSQASTWSALQTFSAGIIVSGGDVDLVEGQSIRSTSTSEGTRDLIGMIGDIVTVGSPIATEVVGSTITLDSAATIQLESTTGVFVVGGLTLNTGSLNLGPRPELTISGGVVTKTASYHNLDTEADAASDDLDTINGGVIGDLIILESTDSARDVTVVHGTGNMRLEGGLDFGLADSNDRIVLLFNGVNWIELTRSNN